MRRRFVDLGAAAMLSLLLAGWATADELRLQPYAYHQGFEGECPKLERWASDGESTVAFAGPSEEQACEGKRSLKLDVTLGGGSYHYFGAPKAVACAGRLKLSAKVFVAKGTTVPVGFGTNMRYPPTHHTGCGSARSFERPTDRWEAVEIDLVGRGRSGAQGVMANSTGTVRGEDVGAVLDRWSLFIYGGKGGRAVVYLDDLRIEGEAPSEEDFAKKIERRWQAGQARLAGRLREWRGQLAEASEARRKLPKVPPEAQRYIKSLDDSLATAGRLVEGLANKGYGSRQDLTTIESALTVARYGPETIVAISQGLKAGDPTLIYTPPAITDVRFTPQGFPIPGRTGKELTCSGCRGEYESVSLVVYALRDIKGLSLTVADLVRPTGKIPAAAVDASIVKSWFQAGREIWSREKKPILTPELLLKDDRLVRVDLAAKQNYLRSTSEDGKETYLLCSGPDSEALAKVRPIDAGSLQAVDIPADTLRQFWLTIRIPDDAKPGSYAGHVRIAWTGGERIVPLEVEVHPFDLAPSRLIYSIYYRGCLAADDKPTIGSEAKSEQQYRAEIRDMKAHGVLYPTNYQHFNERLLSRVMEIRREAGLPTDHFYNLGLGTGSPTGGPELTRLQEDVRKWKTFCAEFGYREVYTYGSDEATGERLTRQRAAWEAVQQAGGKTFVACYYKTFEAMGARLNCAVLAGRPDPNEARKWHSVGSHAFCYAYPQVGNEEPERYRRNFGLVLWKAGFDGAMDYAYQHGFGHIWNDFDHNHYRDHNFTYPTVNGVVGTIQWEGFREAVDDVRYVTTLERAIAGASSEKQAAARQAREWLSTLDPDSADLYAVRAEIVRLIRTLQ